MLNPKTKRVNPENIVELYTMENMISYSACGMPYYIKGSVPSYQNLIIRTPEDFKKQGIDVFLNHKCTRILPDEKSVIFNTMVNGVNEIKKVNYDELKYFSKNNSIEVKELIYTANNPEEFKDIYNQITGDDYQLNGNFIEGFVLEDNKSFMLKTKTAYYEKWKRLRGMMEKSIKNNNYKVKNTGDIEQKFLEFIREKYENKEVDIKDIDIISERKEFEDIK